MSALVAPCEEERFKFLEPHYEPLIDRNDLSQPYGEAIWEVPVHMRRVIAGGKQVLMFIRRFDVQVRRDLTVLFDGQLRVHAVDWSAKLHRKTDLRVDGIHIVEETQQTCITMQPHHD